MKSAPCFSSSLKFVSWTSQQTLQRKNVHCIFFVSRQAQVYVYVVYYYSSYYIYFTSSYRFCIYTCDLGEGAVALRAYVPNEQSWVCSLLHLVIQPKLLGPQTMQKVVLGITDQVSHFGRYYFYECYLSHKQLSNYCLLSVQSGGHCMVCSETSWRSQRRSLCLRLAQDFSRDTLP